jgi:hypothetical protein
MITNSIGKLSGGGLAYDLYQNTAKLGIVPQTQYVENQLGLNALRL